MLWTIVQKQWGWGRRLCLLGVGIIGVTFIVQEVGADISVQKLPSLLLAVCMVGCCLIGCFYGWLGVHQWLVSHKLLKGFGSEARNVMSTLCRISEAHQIVYFAKFMLFLIGMTSILGTCLLKDLRWLGFAFFAVSVCFWLWVRVTTPPFILFLSCSDPTSIQIHKGLKRLVSPLRVLTLLDLGNSPSRDTATELALDCLRTWNGEDWKKVIFILMDMAPVVIMNAEAVSAGVHEEAIYITKNQLLYKTIFMKQSDAALLRLREEPAASAAKCFVVPSTAVKGIVVNMLNACEVPSETRDVCTFLDGV